MDNYEEIMKVTRSGNPSKPIGSDGSKMLKRMNESHYDVTGWALSYFDINEDDKLLDIGCGGGMTLYRLSSLIKNDLVGVDYSLVSVNESRELNKDNKNVKVIEGNVSNLPFNDNEFDKIITVESFYFWPNHEENLKEVLRVLKENGTFMIVNDVYDNGNLDEKTLNNIKEFKMFNPSKELFYDLLVKAGFKDIEIYTKDSWICVKGSK